MLFARGRLAGRLAAFFLEGSKSDHIWPLFPTTLCVFGGVFSEPPNLSFSPLVSIDLTKLHLGTYILKETRASRVQ